MRKLPREDRKLFPRRAESGAEASGGCARLGVIHAGDPKEVLATFVVLRKPEHLKAALGKALSEGIQNLLLLEVKLNCHQDL